MRKKTKLILFAIITIIYIIFGAFLFLNIQFMESPEILINIEVTEVNSKEAILHSIIDVENPNAFDIIMKDLEMVTTTPDGYEVAKIKLEGNKIKSNEKKTFTNDVVFKFDGRSPELLTTKISGHVGAQILFIQKTIPLNVAVVTSMEKIIDELAAPTVDIFAEFVNISQQGIDMNATIEMYNPNSIEIFIQDIAADIKNEKDEVVGELTLEGGTLRGNSYKDFKSNVTILLTSLNAEKLIFNIKGVAGTTIAGFEKNLSLDVKSTIIMPDLESFLLSEDKPTILSIKIDEKITLGGIVFKVQMQVDNSYQIDLILKDIVCRVYTAGNDELKLKGEDDNIEDIFVEAGKAEFSTCEILVPYRKILSTISSDEWLMVSASGKVTIPGVNQKVYLEIRGYHDMKLFR